MAIPTSTGAMHFFVWQNQVGIGGREPSIRSNRREEEVEGPAHPAIITAKGSPAIAGVAPRGGETRARHISALAAAAAAFGHPSAAHVS